MPPAADAPRLPGVTPRRRRGVVERAAAADLKALRAADVIPDGTKALEYAYRLMAREIDDAEHAGDGYRKVTATRELRTLRDKLAPLDVGANDDALRELEARVAATIRDARESGPADTRPAT